MLVVCQFPHFCIRQGHMKRLKNKKEEKLQKGVLFCNFFSFFYNIILQILYSITSKNSIYKNKKE